uniref:Uncharacterized protein n=1 Tax=Setaria viridis TaxID=4556 RepID=A0A4U6TER7_SETVI|nr:hypothetical protein SEVIR_8G081850v2 [Setaria viridis]
MILNLSFLFFFVWEQSKCRCRCKHVLHPTKAKPINHVWACRGAGEHVESQSQPV